MPNPFASDIQVLQDICQRISPLSPEEWALFSGQFKPFNAGRKQFMTRAGEKESYLYVVLEGIQRVFYQDESGREATLVFTYPPSFGGVLDAMMLDQPSRYYYETLTASRFLRAEISEVKKLRNYPGIGLLLELGLAQASSGLLERLVETQVFTSEEKYRSLLKRSPHILNLVPFKYLANYLGIDPTNFSKLIHTVKM
jgi:CRP-like cAMP-binding protein